MNHIVIGVDGSPAATAAARWAACEAAMRNVELTVVHVLQSAPEVWLQTGWPAIPLPAEVGEDQLAQGETILEDTLSVIAKTTGVRQPRSIASSVCIGAVVPTLSGFSHKESQMIVVGRRGRGGIHRALLGSVSSGVLHNAHGPVAVVHHRVSPVPPSAPVVVGVDGPPASESASAIAFDEASRRGVDVVAVHGFDHPDTSMAEALLGQRLAGWQERYPDVAVHRVITRDHPADALLDQSRHAQLVVVGRRGHGRLAGKLLGSVSAAVAQACRIPVIIAGRACPHTICASPRRARNVPHDEQCRILACCRRR